MVFYHYIFGVPAHMVSGVCVVRYMCVQRTITGTRGNDISYFKIHRIYVCSYVHRCYGVDWSTREQMWFVRWYVPVNLTYCSKYRVVIGWLVIVLVPFNSVIWWIEVWVYFWKFDIGLVFASTLTKNVNNFSASLFSLMVSRPRITESGVSIIFALIFVNSKQVDTSFLYLKWN